MKEKRIPEVRFEGFVDDWEQRKLTELGTIGRGKSKHRPRNDKALYGGEYPFVQTGDVAKSGLFLNNYQQTYSEFGIKQSKLWSRGTLLITIAANIAEMSVLDIEAAFPDSIIGFEPKFSDVVFVKYSIENIINVLKNKAETSSQANLNLAKLSELDLMVPNETEQKTIGNFFIELEKTITLQERKLSLLKLTKKGLLQQFFPKNKKALPDIRFTNFQEVWEKRKLGNIVEIIMGQSPNSENYTDNPLDNILVQGNADMKNGRVVPRVWTKQITKKAERNDLILSVRAPVGDIGKTDYSIVIGRGVAAIRGNEFIFQTLGKMKIDGYWNKLSTGSTFESINSNDIKEAQIKIPNIKEQTKIGNFFKQLDETITLQEKKINQLKQIKKALLQKMFI